MWKIKTFECFSIFPGRRMTNGMSSGTCCSAQESRSWSDFLMDMSVEWNGMPKWCSSGVWGNTSIAIATLGLWARLKQTRPGTIYGKQCLEPTMRCLRTKRVSSINEDSKRVQQSIELGSIRPPLLRENMPFPRMYWSLLNSTMCHSFRIWRTRPTESQRV